MSSQQKLRCYYNLYDYCIYFDRTNVLPDINNCSLCLKAYRLKHGLKNILIAEGTRTGVTL